MLRHNLARCCVPLAVAAVLVVVPTASADKGTGGAAAMERPEVDQVVCVSSKNTPCARGQLLRVKGDGLQSTEAVVFRGGRGRWDDRRARPRTRGVHSLFVRVPAGARSGPIQVSAAGAVRSVPTAPVQLRAKPRRKAPAQLAAPVSGGVFPIRGEHTYGTDINRFGGGRGHKGQDVLAECGTPLVAALSGTVSYATFQDRAGNYAVITAEDGTSQAYMHMRAPALVSKGDRVQAGQQIGEVGNTGRSSGCHLHFEFWTAPGWYEGGKAIDPLPFLRGLDRGV